MRASVQASDLAAALGQSISVGSTPMRVLQHARLVAHGDHLTLETTDTQVYVKYTIPAAVEAAGHVQLPMALLPPVAAGSGEIRIEPDGTCVRGRSRFRLPALAGEDLPQGDDYDYEPMGVDGGVLADALDQVAYAADAECARHWARQVNVVPGAVWAGDGPQVAFLPFDYAGPVVAIPVGQIRRVTSALQAEGATVAIGNVREGRAGMLRVDSERMSMVVVLLDARAPDIVNGIRGVVVDEEAGNATFSRTGLQTAIRRLVPFAQYNFGGTKAKAILRMGLEVRDGSASLWLDGSDTVEALDDCVEACEGVFRFLFDPKRLLDALGAIPAEKVRIAPPGRGGAAALRITGTGADGAQHVLAPLT